MSQTELKADQTSTYDAILRLIDAEKTRSKMFVKLVERLEWTNAEMIKKGFLDPEANDAKAIREAWIA